MAQFIFGLVAGIVVGLMMEWVIDWGGLLPKRSGNKEARPSRTKPVTLASAPRAQEQSLPTGEPSHANQDVSGE